MNKCLHLSEKYKGCYVAMKDENDTTVVGSGATPAQALSQAEIAGCKNPMFYYVPEKDSVLIY